MGYALAAIIVFALVAWLLGRDGTPDRQRVALMRPDMLDEYEASHFDFGGRASYRILYTIGGSPVAETSVVEMLPPATWMRARVAELRAQGVRPTVLRCTRKGGQWKKETVDV